MPDTAQRLRDIAVRQCLPYLLALSRLAQYSSQLSFVLVGSVATGLCREGSDIDIAVVCEPEVYDAIARDTPWAAGRPCETEIDGVQLHYYAITVGTIESKLRELDDVALHIYGSAVVLWDPECRYRKQFAWVTEYAEQVRRERIEGKLDMLFRRARGLEQCLATGDVLTVGSVCLELITRCLKVAGLLDSVAFDPRKRLFVTATAGAVGRLVDPELRRLLACIGELAEIREPSDFATFGFVPILRNVLDVLAKEGRRQGLQIGLEAPDRRQMHA